MSLKQKIKAGRQSTSKRLRFLSGNFHLILIWPFAALVLSVAGWNFLLSTMEAEQHQAGTASLQHAASLSRAYADQLTHTLDTVDQLILHVKYEWELSKRQLKLESPELLGLFPPTSQFFVAIIDRDGTLLTSTIADAEKMDVAGSPYFTAQKNSKDDFLYIGTPTTAHSANSNVIQFSRKLLDRDGRFDGVILASVAPSYLTQNYDDSALGINGLLGIVGSDNAIRVTRIGNHLQAPTTPTWRSTPQFHASSGSVFLSGGQWFADNRGRYLGWQKVRAYPIIALVGLDAHDALAPFHLHRTASIHVAIWATLALGLFTIIAMLLSIRLSWRKHQLRIAQTTYRKATEEGKEGFYIARPISRHAGMVSDYQIVDCNNYGAELFFLRRADLIGKRVSSLGKGEAIKLIIEKLHQAMDEEFLEEEIELPEALSMAPKWVNFKAVFSEGDLAVTLRDISDAKSHVAELERLSNEDELTGLPNRHWTKTYLAQAIERAEQNHETLAVLYVDLDGFKTVNDTMGHAAGDELLCNAARRLKLAVRPQDHVVRLGGDEFVVILEHIATSHEVMPIAERILHAFEQSFKLTNGTHTLGASIGISVYPGDGHDASTLLRHADIAMYAVKTNGKANYRFYDPRMFEALCARLKKEAELRHAIEQDQFVMYYQPRVDISTGVLSSMESLVRWQHPTKGIVGPNEFIPLAEETGLILELGEIIINKVFAQMARWEKTRKDLVPVSINVSPRQFKETNVKEIFAAALARYQVDASLIEIEVTESSMMGDSDEIAETLNELQRMGIKLLVDDFGTGYSSLSQLQQLDFDVLKVDRAFTSKIDCTDDGNIFFNAIVTMAHALGMRVVAEGVENEKQIEILQSLHCDEIQGFYISKPLPAAEKQPVLPRWAFASAA